MAGIQSGAPVSVLAIASTTVGAAAVGTLLLAANSARVAATIQNNANTNLRVDDAGTEVIVAPGSTYSLSAGNVGAVDGFWDGTPTGTALMQEQSSGLLQSSMTPAQGAIMRITAGGPAPGQSQKNFSGTYTQAGTGAVSIPLYTPPAGKRYQVTDVIITANGLSTSTLQAVLRAATVPVLPAFINNTKGLEAIGLETGPVIPAGSAIDLYIPAYIASATVAYAIYGVEY